MENLRPDSIRSELKTIIRPYLEKLLGAHKDNIISIVLYGSATGKYFVPGKSDINLAVVFKELGFQQLKDSLSIIRYGITKRITAPLLLSVSQIESSTSAFPIEFFEIKENHILLYGGDVFSNLKIDESSVMVFSKKEILGKLIRLRQAYLETGLKRRGVEALMKGSMYSLIPVFRAMLRQKIKNPPVDKEQALIEFCNHYGLSKDVFIAILRDKVNDEKIKGEDVGVFFEKYIKEIEKIS